VPVLVDPSPSGGTDKIAALYDQIAEDPIAELVRVQSRDCEHVTIIGAGEDRRKQAIAAAASRPTSLHVYSIGSLDLSALHEAVQASPERNGRRIGTLETTVVKPEASVPTIAQTELLIAPTDSAETMEHRVVRTMITWGEATLPPRWRLAGRPHGLYLYSSLPAQSVG
jgi:hypothetical protein